MRWLIMVAFLSVALPAGVMLWSADYHPDRSFRACMCGPDCDCGQADECTCGE